ncbi:hypothetical protein TSMEX_000637 [Taenia solium]|eukprot:TsM_000201900 transcript=TsM_000201900 gene=TsM_000201900
MCPLLPHRTVTPEHRIRRFIYEREYGYCSQSRRSDFVLVELEDTLVYSYRVQPIPLYCATHPPSQTAALGFHFPGQLYGFLNEALVNVRRGEHRYLQALNHDIPSDTVGPPCQWSRRRQTAPSRRRLLTSLQQNQLLQVPRSHQLQLGPKPSSRTKNELATSSDLISSTSTSHFYQINERDLLRLPSNPIKNDSCTYLQ